MPEGDVEERAERHFFSRNVDLAVLADARRRKASHIIGLLKPFLAGRKIESALSIGSSYCIVEEEVHKALFPDARFTCTDLDRKALEHFGQPTLVKEVRSATDLDYPDGSFDFIMAHQVLEHINGYRDVLESFRRICRPNGIIYINVPNPLSPMVGKEPTGEWPKPFLRALLSHNARKLRRDFMTNTEKYHTGFTRRYLRGVMKGFSIHDLRKARLKQELTGRLSGLLVDMVPSFLLFLPVETNLWCLVKGREGA